MNIWCEVTQTERIGLHP